MTPNGPSTAKPPQQPDLRSLINTRRAELLNVLAALKTDTRIEAVEARGRIKAKLSELAHVVKWGVVDDWANVGGPVTRKLQQWLTESTQQVPPAPATTAVSTTTPAPAKAEQP